MNNGLLIADTQTPKGPPSNQTNQHKWWPPRPPRDPPGDPPKVQQPLNSEGARQIGWLNNGATTYYV